MRNNVPHPPHYRTTPEELNGCMNTHFEFSHYCTGLSESNNPPKETTAIKQHHHQQQPPPPPPPQKTTTKQTNKQKIKNKQTTATTKQQQQQQQKTTRRMKTKTNKHKDNNNKKNKPTTTTTTNNKKPNRPRNHQLTQLPVILTRALQRNPHPCILISWRCEVHKHHSDKLMSCAWATNVSRPPQQF